jgi:hypothetical protein
MQKRNNFGQAAAMVGVAAANAAVNVHNVVQVDKIQKQQQSKLEADEMAMTYAKNLVYRLETLGTRLAKTSGIAPGTPEFESLLKKALAPDMVYQGNCNVDIFVTPTGTSKTGEPRAIWGSVNRTGFLSQPTTLPPDVGPLWATGCKNAQDKFRIARIEAIKGSKQFEHIKLVKSDTGAVSLFIAFGAGLLLVVAFLLSIKMQSAVIKEQRRKKPKSKPKRKTR